MLLASLIRDTGKVRRAPERGTPPAPLHGSLPIFGQVSLPPSTGAGGSRWRWSTPTPRTSPSRRACLLPLATQRCGGFGILRAPRSSPSLSTDVPSFARRSDPPDWVREQGLCPPRIATACSRCHAAALETKQCDGKGQLSKEPGPFKGQFSFLPHNSAHSFLHTGCHSHQDGKKKGGWSWR